MQQDHTEGHHVVPVRTYLIVFAALMVLAIATIAVSYVNLGAFNNFIALAIAVSKAFLIMAFFMHLKYTTNKLTVLIALMGFFWLLIFFAITMGDYLARGTIPGDLGPQSVFAPWM